MIRVRTTFILMVITAIFTPVFKPLIAQERAQSETPKIGLVLGGGGARGVAHIGVLRALEELGIRPDIVTGTSMGAIVGGLYASGYSVNELEEIVNGIDWIDAFDDRTSRKDLSMRRKLDDKRYLVDYDIGVQGLALKLPEGLVEGQKIKLLLERLTLPVAKIRNFDELPVPFRAIAADIETGQQVVLSQGDLALAIRASMSLPAVFPPVEIDGLVLVDGGIANNLPIRVAKEMGADVVIAVDVSSPLGKREDLSSAISILSQLSSFLVQQNTQPQLDALTDRDFLLKPELGDISTGSFLEASQAIDPGYQSAMAIQAELTQLALMLEPTDRAPRAYSVVTEQTIIGFIEVVNDSVLSDKVVSELISLKAGDTLNVDKLERDLARIYGLKYFERVDYDVVEKGGRTGLIVFAKAKAWNADSFRFGLTLEDDFDGESNYNLAASFTKTGLNSLGGEWRTDVRIGDDPLIFTEFYQPLRSDLRPFIRSRIQLERSDVNLFEDGTRVAEYRVRDVALSFDAGWQFSSYGVLDVEVVRAWGDAKLSIGPTGVEDQSFNRGELVTRFIYDQIDDISWPKDGEYLSLKWLSSLKELGADENYDTISYAGNITRTFDRNTFFLRSEGGLTVSAKSPVYDLFQLGGLNRLAGFTRNELSGQNYVYGSVGGYRRLTERTMLGMPVYAGATLEAGNVWENRGDISANDLIFGGSVFVGADTIAGPVYLAYGHAEQGRDSVYLFLGRQF